MERFATQGSPFWLDASPLVLASQSQARRLLLEAAQIPFVIRPAQVDERALEAEVLARSGDASEIAAQLAQAKAQAVSAKVPRAYVLGADQVASCNGRIFGKPPDRAGAAEQLSFLSGRAHRLHSGYALAKGGRLVDYGVCHADLVMRALGEAFVDAYLDALGEKVLTSAGAYQVEALGVHLFAAVRGDHWTIMGLPLPPILEALRREGALLG